MRDWYDFEHYRRVKLGNQEVLYYEFSRYLMEVDGS